MPSLSSIAGHRRLAALLSRAIARGTLPPTLLFVGPAGVGKYLTARAAATTLNCLTPIKDAAGLAIDACLVCRSCDRISRHVHVDVLAVEPDDKASIKIDVVRDVLARTEFRPFEGRRRAIVIRDAEALEPQAQNALLKSLEEPPPSTVFILTTAVPGVLLPTVRSRCMRLRFGRLTEADVAGVLSTEHGLPADEARSAAALADGSVGQALALRSADLDVLRDLATRLVDEAARRTPVGSRLQVAAAIAVEKPRVDRSREDVKLVLQFAASMLRDIELLNAAGEARALANPLLAGELGALTKAFHGDRAREAFAVVNQAIRAVSKPRNAGTKVVADWVAANI